MIAIDVQADGLRNLERFVLVSSERTRQALLAAIRGEAFSMRQTLRQNIIMGAAAPGAPFRPLSLIARAFKRRRGFGLRAPFPLRRLAAAVTYAVDAGEMSARVGFTALSPAWARKVAAMHQVGFVRPVTQKMREAFAREGARRAESRSRRARKTSQPLFLRKETTVLRTPARPIIDPFWRFAAPKAVEAIRRNFREKLSGRTFAAGVMERYAVPSAAEFWEGA